MQYVISAMKYLYVNIFILFVLLILFVSNIEAREISDSLLHRQYKTNMHYNPAIATSSGDSVNMIIFNEVRRFDTDAFMERLATRPWDEMHEELYYYYADFLMYVSLEKKQEELDKMRRFARLYKNKQMEYESEYLENHFIFENKDRSVEKIRTIEAAAKRAEKRGDLVMKIRMRHHMFLLFITYIEPYYYDAFRIAEELLTDLDKVDETLYPDKRMIYFEIGQLYYRFRDYDKAIPLLEKALTDRSRYFYDRSNLRARNTLGVYYRREGNIERSDEYFISMLESPDMVKYRPMYDAIAIANLGHNRVETKQYDEAIKLYHIALPVSIAENDSAFASGITLGLGECYLGKGEINKVKDMIDTTRIFIHRHYFVPADLHRYRDLYPLISKYYARIGNTELSEVYMDSTFVAYKRFENDFNALTILRAKQELFDIEKQAKDEEISSKQRQLLISLISGVLTLISLTVIVYYYRKKRAAYHALVVKVKQWADNDTLERIGLTATSVKDIEPTDSFNNGYSNEVIQDKESPNQKEVDLTSRIHEMMLTQHLYKDSTLTLDSLAKRLDVNREAVSRAINRTTGKNFTRFLNEYRIKEAIRIMADSKHRSVYIDDIYEDVGFNSRGTFYRVFKQITGLAPNEFKNNK